MIQTEHTFVKQAEEADVQSIAMSMLQELLDNRLSVVLIPAPEPKHEGQQIRVVQDQNPKWYRELLAEYQRDRRQRAPKYTDSIINRSGVIKALRHIIEGRQPSTIYMKRLLPHIEQERRRNYCGCRTTRTN